MAAAWPAGFPSPLREGYGYSAPELVLRSDFALGARVRPLYTDGPDTFRCILLLTALQCQFFKGWLRYDVANGADWFLLPLLVDGTLTTREVRLTAQPTYELVAFNSWRVSLAVETRTGTTISEAAYLAL